MGVVCVFAAMSAVCVAQNQTQFNVTTWHYDIWRAGQNNSETMLTTSVVGNTKTFGKICGLTVDGKVFAQPLIVTNVKWQGGPAKTVGYIVTQNDSVYAIDATNPTTCNVLAGPVSLLVNASQGEIPADCHKIGGMGCQTIANNVGILGTPVIDTSTGTMYAVAESECPTLSQCAQGGTDTFFHRLHALDIATLSVTRERYNAPVQICLSGCAGSTGSKFAHDISSGRAYSGFLQANRGC